MSEVVIGDEGARKDEFRGGGSGTGRPYYVLFPMLV